MHRTPSAGLVGVRAPAQQDRYAKRTTPTAPSPIDRWVGQGSTELASARSPRDYLHKSGRLGATEGV